MLKTRIWHMNVYILDDFVPDDHTLKYKSSIDKLIISSHGMEMMSLSCAVGVTSLLHLYRFWRAFGTLLFDNLCINKPILCLTNIFNGSILVIVYNCSVVWYEYVIILTILFCSLTSGCIWVRNALPHVIYSTQ